MSTTIDARIAKLEASLKQAKAQKQKIEARKRAVESKQKRALDTRKKILIGAAIQSMIERGQWTADNLQKIMDQTLVRDDDRALFNLPPQSHRQRVRYPCGLFSPDPPRELDPDACQVHKPPFYQTPQTDSRRLSIGEKPSKVHRKTTTPRQPSS